jgi:hypothetical protein
MSDFVRVRMSNGHEVTLSRSFAEGSGLEVLDAPATDLRGRPLSASRKDGRRMKPKATVEKEVAKKVTSHQSDPGPSDATTNDGVAVAPEEASA